MNVQDTPRIARLVDYFKEISMIQYEREWQSITEISPRSVHIYLKVMLIIYMNLFSLYYMYSIKEANEAKEAKHIVTIIMLCTIMLEYTPYLRILQGS